MEKMCNICQNIWEENVCMSRSLQQNMCILISWNLGGKGYIICLRDLRECAHYISRNFGGDVCIIHQAISMDIGALYIKKNVQKYVNYI